VAAPLPALGRLGAARLEGTLAALLLALSLAGLLVAANPVSGALADCAAAAVASIASAGVGTVSITPDSRIGAGCVAGAPAMAELRGELSCGKMLSVELPTLTSVELRSAGGAAFVGSLRSTPLLSPRRACGVGVGLGASIEAEDGCAEKCQAGLRGGAGPGPTGNETTRGFEERAGSNDGVAFGTGVAGVGGSGLANAGEAVTVEFVSVVDVLESFAPRMANDCKASGPASPTTDGGSGDFERASLRTGEFAATLAGPERTARPVRNETGWRCRWGNETPGSAESGNAPGVMFSTVLETG